jgi:hypothetical protein
LLPQNLRQIQARVLELGWKALLSLVLQGNKGAAVARIFFIVVRGERTKKKEAEESPIAPFRNAHLTLPCVFTFSADAGLQLQEHSATSTWSYHARSVDRRPYTDLAHGNIDSIAGTA